MQGAMARQIVEGQYDQYAYRMSEHPHVDMKATSTLNIDEASQRDVSMPRHTLSSFQIGTADKNAEKSKAHCPSAINCWHGQEKRAGFVEAAPLAHFEEFFGLTCKSRADPLGSVQVCGFGPRTLERRVQLSYHAAHMQETLEILKGIRHFESKLSKSSEHILRDIASAYAGDGSA